MEQGKSWPSVTVFTLCYNTGKYVIEAVESIRANNYPNLQHIIIDDCSTDGESIQLIESWIKENNYDCQFIKHEKNKGICKSLNEILDLATGEYFTGICDDLWTEDRLEKEMQIMINNPDLGLVFGNAYIIDKDSKLTGAMYGKSEHLNSVASENRYISELEVGNYIIPPACLYRTSVLKELGGYDESLNFEDWDMFLRIAKSNYRIKYFDHAVVKYRQYSTSFWHSRSPKLLKSLIRIYDKHGLFEKSDSFISYMNNFRSLNFIEKIGLINNLIAKGRFKLSIIILLGFIYSPMKLQHFFYKKMYSCN